MKIMNITVKNIYQREEIFEVNLEDPLSVLASLIKERFNYENNVKIIHIGKVLLHNIIMKEYFNDIDKITLVCLEEKNKNIQINKIRAIIYSFFTLVSNDTALNYLFFNNPKTIQLLLKNGHLDSLIKQFIENSDKITNILESGSNESIDIELSSELKKNILNSILSESTILNGFN